MHLHSACLYSSSKCSLASNGLKVQMLWPNVHLTPYMSPLCDNGILLGSITIDSKQVDSKVLEGAKGECDGTKDY